MQSYAYVFIIRVGEIYVHWNWNVHMHIYNNIWVKTQYVTFLSFLLFYKTIWKDDWLLKQQIVLTVGKHVLPLLMVFQFDIFAPLLLHQDMNGTQSQRGSCVEGSLGVCTTVKSECGPLSLFPGTGNSSKKWGEW
jgi:hypothetical protein